MNDYLSGRHRLSGRDDSSVRGKLTGAKILTEFPKACQSLLRLSWLGAEPMRFAREHSRGLSVLSLSIESQYDCQGAEVRQLRGLAIAESKSQLTSNLSSTPASRKGSFTVLSLHQTGTPPGLTLQKHLQNQRSFVWIADGTTIALVLARKGNNSIK